MPESIVLFMAACALGLGMIIAADLMRKTPEVACIEQRGRWITVPQISIFQSPTHYCEFGRKP